ncbi:hypothetical protein SAMN02799624_03057 [Paenibacillus sp. UNC496MF]|uniref:hypothetical protein n=1 Tax=Paenibacillus sp. UNC496MF TaxID=1502753 RepID=UPI0008EDEC2B|nr:hypothetical protein [Paenibacillus sp. UNC496MF]SFJ02524.1 hypothetical protein SAMN02799624_03057 [Paenibacillus sp. UNC496MF]
MPNGSDEEIWRELRRINDRLDRLEASRGSSWTMKLAAALFGFLVVGPLAVGLLAFALH